jgi:hypothetical protein
MRLVEFIQTYDNEPILVNPDHVLYVERAFDRLQNPDGKTYKLTYLDAQCYISYALFNQRPEYDDPIFKSRVFGSLAEVKAKLEGKESAKPISQWGIVPRTLEELLEDAREEQC